MHENNRKNYQLLVLDKKVCKGKTNICFTKVVELVIDWNPGQQIFVFSSCDEFEGRATWVEPLVNLDWGYQ